jgi:hypothetical protein
MKRFEHGKIEYCNISPSQLMELKKELASKKSTNREQTMNLALLELERLFN